MISLTRGGIHYRVCDPAWSHPLDTSYSKRSGGRWNPAAEFGALYLNATVAVAAANARRNYQSEIATLFDLQPQQRPDLVVVTVATSSFLDAVTARGLKAIGLPVSYPVRVGRARCQAIARRVYRSNLKGVASRSNAEATSTAYVGEELAVFDRACGIVSMERRVRFARWYPTELPERTAREPGRGND